VKLVRKEELGTWLRNQFDQAKEFLAARSAQPAMMQDGGAPSRVVLRQYDADVWKSSKHVCQPRNFQLTKVRHMQRKRSSYRHFPCVGCGACSRPARKKTTSRRRKRLSFPPRTIPL